MKLDNPTSSTQTYSYKVFRNYGNYGVPFPNQQAMRVYSSMWNANNWATRCGLVKMDWNSAPFIAYYQYMQLRACPFIDRNMSHSRWLHNIF
ncbi:hypothetical protein Cni_G13909 [Canna indica]|uniref:GH16 domain-containing protein n=1 Tax=Canna indica TaxID=4628 RepID=A0AAQ3KDH8_9LILI|nr:hypothetical protein Cni_G13909 [Canna indica]